MSTSDLTTNELFQALIRMISRRGLCKTIWSDNAKTFKSADRQLQQLFTRRHKIDQKGLQDKLTFWESNGGSLSNVPLGVVAGGRGCYAPWRNLSQGFGQCKALLSYQELATALTRIEGVINSIKAVHDRKWWWRDLTPVTPVHLAHGRPLFSLSDIADEVSANEGTTRQRYLYQQKLLHHFWQRWRGEYLSQLSIRYQWCVNSQPS